MDNIMAELNGDVRDFERAVKVNLIITEFNCPGGNDDSLGEGEFYI